MNIKKLGESSIILMMVLLVPFASAYNETFVEKYIDDIVSLVNSRPRLSQLLTESKYDSMKLDIDGHEYYLAFEGNISRVESASPDFTIEMDYPQFVSLAEAHSARDGSRVSKIMMKVTPFRVKLSLLVQCLKTKWCRG